MTQAQKYGVATMLATSNLESVVARLTELGADDAVEFAKSVDRHYKSRNGFVPKRVITICK